MSRPLKTFAVLLLLVLSVIVQLAVWCSAFRVTSNLEWHPVQLIAFAFDGMAILAIWRFLRCKPTFSAAALFVLVSDIALFYLALVAREAPYRFPHWLVR